MVREDRRDRRRGQAKKWSTDKQCRWQWGEAAGVWGGGSKKVRVGDSCISHPQSSENDLFSAWPPKGGFPGAGCFLNSEKFVMGLIYCSTHSCTETPLRRYLTISHNAPHFFFIPYFFTLVVRIIDNEADEMCTGSTTHLSVTTRRAGSALSRTHNAGIITMSLYLPALFKRPWILDQAYLLYKYQLVFNIWLESFNLMGLGPLCS